MCDGYHSNLLLDVLSANGRGFIYHGFEPVKELFDGIHLRYNSNIGQATKHNLAIGRVVGQVEFYKSGGERIENGVVKGIEPQEQPEEVVAAEEMNTNQEFETKFAELNERLSKLEAALGISNTALEAANAQIVAQNDLNRKLFALVEKVADAPSVEPKSTAKENFKKTSSLSSLDEFRKQVFK
jgi:uncharacterized coiled-coil protein SlyX